MNETILVNGQSYHWKSPMMYEFLMGCYPDRTGLRYKSSRSQQIFAVLFEASPGVCSNEFLANSLFGVDDYNAREAVAVEVVSTRRRLKSSKLHEQVAIYTVHGQGYLLSPKLTEGEMLILPDGQVMFVRGDKLVNNLK